MVSPDDSEHVINYLTCSGVPFDIGAEDVQELIDHENDRGSDDDDDDDLIELRGN